MLGKILKFSAYTIIINLGVLAQMAQAEDKTWNDDSISQDVQDICNKADMLQIPLKDMPSEVDKISLKNCSSRNLYYGISGPQDSIAARKCAILEFKNKDNDFVKGASILMMLYANGEGVKKNAALARKMACDMWSAPYELEMRIGYLSEPNYKPIDICDHITSGVMMGFCASISSDMHEETEFRELKTITKKWPVEDQKKFKKLLNAANDYADSHSMNEVDMGGTARGAFSVEAKGEVMDNFRKSIKNFENSQIPHYSKDDFIKADKKLNETYKLAIKSNYDEISQITAQSIKKTQLSWLKYRDAWVEFAIIHYPQISTDSIKTFFTSERISLLEDISEGNPNHLN